MKKEILSFLIGGDDADTEPPAAGRMLFGGSFNPVHRGHLELIEFVLDQELARSILIMPAGQSPFKGKKSYAPGEHRLEMLRLAVGTLSDEMQQRIEVSDLELKRPGPSYTSETLEQLDDRIQTALMVGADSLESFHLWKEADLILGRVPLYVFFRAGIEEGQVRAWRRRLQGFFPVARVYLISYVPASCSSTEIRKTIARGAGFEELRACLPQSVFALIKHSGMYAETDSNR